MVNRKLKHVLEAILAAVIAIAVGHLSIGCKPTVSPEETLAQYTAELELCVTNAHSKAEADECRKQVNIKYGVCDQVQWPRSAPGC